MGLALTTKEIETMRNDLLGPRMVETFKKRHFDAWYFSNREDALSHLFTLIPGEHVVSWGGSLTRETLGIQQMLADRKYAVIDRDSAKDPGERMELMRKALTCDTFITGVNAISESGELVQVDCFGNRVAATLFGPKQVIVITGMNKIVKTLKDAYQRARNVASPKNIHRLANRKTLCLTTGVCGDCTSPDCMCTYVVTTRVSTPAGRIKIILINENLGL